MNWGPPTWIFFHTLAEKIKEDSFPVIGQQLIGLIIKICCNLPCPDCSQHSKQFWARVKMVTLKNKQDLIHILFIFHNMVNKRRRIPEFKKENLGLYKEKKLLEVYNQFTRNFNTNGNMNLINDSFHRNMMLSSLKTWFIHNIQYFNIQ